MSLYLFDTDTVSDLQDGHAAVSLRVSRHSPSELATSAITVQEMLDGWYSRLPRMRQPPQIAHAYKRLADSVKFIATLNILHFTVPAILRFDQLKSLKLNIGKMDLRIAAIALEHQAILITRNTRDFHRVPGLVFEDWTV